MSNPDDRAWQPWRFVAIRIDTTKAYQSTCQKHTIRATGWWFDAAREMWCSSRIYRLTTLPGLRMEGIGAVGWAAVRDGPEMNGMVPTAFLQDGRIERGFRGGGSRTWLGATSGPSGL